MTRLFRHGALAIWLASVAALPAAETNRSPILPVRGLCIPAPSTSRLEQFLQFIERDLASRSVNTLILRVDYAFQFTRRPRLADPNGLSKAAAERLTAVARKHGIRIIPLVNLLGHQSWQSHAGTLLRVHPEFDETPHVRLPTKYTWPNPDRLYCKSYCPRHPEVHGIVFDLIDEVCNAFEADAFHAGMDEVFYLGDDQCERCRGRSKAELFADEVGAIRTHLQASNRRLWIWGDRLLDGRTTGLGEWEASFNETHSAIDRISKDVVICDWHYERPVPTAAYFALKGFDVVSCPWKKAQVGVAQVRDMIRFRDASPDATRQHFLGVVQTVWSGASSFLDQLSGHKPDPAPANADEPTEARCFQRVFEVMAAAPAAK